MIRPLKTAYLIADGRRARWVERDHETGALRTVRELHRKDKATHGHSGTVFESVGHQRHGVREPQEPRRREAMAFAADVAASASDVVCRFVVVAPARMLAAIEAALPPASRARLAATLAKDLTKVPDHELARWLP